MFVLGESALARISKRDAGFDRKFLTVAQLFSLIFSRLEAHGRAPSPASAAEKGCGASPDRREACESAVDRPILCRGVISLKPRRGLVRLQAGGVLRG